MAIAVNNVIELVVVQTFISQQVLNVFHYRVVSLPTAGNTYTLFAQGFWDKVKTQWRAFVTGSYWGASFLEVRALDVTDGLGFGNYTIPGGEATGTRVASGDGMPINTTGTIKLSVSSRLTRPGSKRITGVMEVDQVQGTLTTTPITLLDALGSVLDGSFFYGSGTPDGEAEPVIYGEPNANRPTAVANPVTGHLTSTFVTTQNTRKVYR